MTQTYLKQTSRLKLFMKPKYSPLEAYRIYFKYVDVICTFLVMWNTVDILSILSMHVCVFMHVRTHEVSLRESVWGRVCVNSIWMIGKNFLPELKRSRIRTYWVAFWVTAIFYCCKASKQSRIKMNTMSKWIQCQKQRHAKRRHVLLIWIGTCLNRTCASRMLLYINSTSKYSKGR